MNKLVGYRINPREMQNEILKSLIEILGRFKKEEYDEYPFIMIEVSAVKSYEEEMRKRHDKRKV